MARIKLNFDDLKIVSEKVEETNPFANPDKANNGGGYSQPRTTMKLSNGWSAEILDSSCGDFGTRYFAVAINPDGVSVADCAWGTMEPENNGFLIEYAFRSDYATCKTAQKILNNICGRKCRLIFKDGDFKLAPRKGWDA